jgi:glycosyltransferase involved in cell wall biosynthesis
MSLPYFSVVIPAFNRNASLGRAIESVLAQTDTDFEIIVIDDGSDEPPDDIVGRLNDPRVRLIRQSHAGGGAARNCGIAQARGRYIAFLDSDDAFLPKHLERMRTLLADRSDVIGYAPLIVDRGRGRSFIKPPRAIASGEHMATYLLCDRGFVPTITLVVPKPVAQEVRYDESQTYAQDTDFALRLFLAGYRFEMADLPGAIWRDTPDPRRTSAGRKGVRLIPWLERFKPQIPVRAWYGARGWVVAKGIAATDPARALVFYLQAVVRGCYAPRLAIIVLLQIVLPDRWYRALADWAIGHADGSVWSRREKRGFAGGQPSLSASRGIAK